MLMMIPDVSIPGFQLKVGKTPVSAEVKADIFSVELKDQIDVPALLTIKLSMWDGEQQRIKDEHLDKFQLGTSVEVDLGLNELTHMFTGQVTSLSPDFGGVEGGDSLTIEALDLLHLSRFGTKQRTLAEKTDSQIAIQIGEELGLTVEAEDTAFKRSHVTQENENDLMFMMRTKPSNYELNVEGTTLFFRKTRDSESPVITLTYRRDLMEFHPRLRSIQEGEKVVVRSWDFKNKKPIVGTATSGDEASKVGGAETGAEASRKAFGFATRTISNQKAIDADEAQEIAKGWFHHQQQNFIKADGKCPGIPTLRAGKTVEITEVGKAFSGIYYVTSSKHTFGAGGYTTSFEVRRNAMT